MKEATRKQIEEILDTPAKTHPIIGQLPPQDLELEAGLLHFLEKQQAKKQSIQSFVDYIPEKMFYREENQARYDAIIQNHKQERRKEISQPQAYWVSDLIDLKKKRELLGLIDKCMVKLYDNKQSFKIIKGRLFAQVEAI